MASEYDYGPAVVAIRMTQGDELSLVLDFDIDLTGYTFASSVTDSAGDSKTITVTNTDLAAGQITLSLSETDSADLAVGIGRWRLSWTVSTVKRTVLAGRFRVLEP